MPLTVAGCGIWFPPTASWGSATPSLTVNFPRQNVARAGFRNSLRWRKLLRFRNNTRAHENHHWSRTDYRWHRPLHPRVDPPGFTGGPRSGSEYTDCKSHRWSGADAEARGLYDWWWRPRPRGDWRHGSAGNTTALSSNFSLRPCFRLVGVADGQRCRPWLNQYE